MYFSRELYFQVALSVLKQCRQKQAPLTEIIPGCAAQVGDMRMPFISAVHVLANVASNSRLAAVLNIEVVVQSDSRQLFVEKCDAHSAAERSMSLVDAIHRGRVIV